MKDLFKFLQEKKCFVFDFDGTITDTEVLHYLAHKNIMAEYGIDLPREVYNEICMGKSLIDSALNLKKKYNLKIDCHEYVAKKLAYFAEAVQQSDIQIFDYVYSVMGKFPNKSYYILSNTERSSLIEMCDKLNLDKSRFIEIFSCNDMNILKSDFLKNMDERLGFNKNEIVIFEDSIENVSVSKNLGYETVGIAHSYNKEIAKIADYLIEIK